ncbi:MAG TPA: PDZ domain-containing protein [Campylobacterales bacterium]|nr:PDZ domain-containing protein [Campylobacterales bacterium]
MRHGIPSRVPYAQTVILQDEDAQPKSADFIFFTDAIETKQALKLGVGLEFSKLRITKVAEKSLAEKLGLKKGDLILEIDGAKIKDIFELKLALFFKKENELISLTYKRGKKIITQSSR